MSEPKIVILDDAPALYAHAAEEIAHFAGEAVCTRGEFTLCLSGGSTPAATYEMLGSKFHFSIDWKEVQFFWGDERCVPPEDAASNYAMTLRTLLSKLTLKPSQVHRIHGENSPDEAARAYEDELRNHFALGAGEFPRFVFVAEPDAGRRDREHCRRHALPVHQLKILGGRVIRPKPQRKVTGEPLDFMPLFGRQGFQKVRRYEMVMAIDHARIGGGGLSRRPAR